MIAEMFAEEESGRAIREWKRATKIHANIRLWRSVHANPALAAHAPARDIELQAARGLQTCQKGTLP